MFKILLGSVGIVALLALVIVMIIVGKIFGKPIGFLFKIAGIIIGIAIIAVAVICSLPYLIMGGIILILVVILSKLLFHKSKG